MGFCWDGLGVCGERRRWVKGDGMREGTTGRSEGRRGREWNLDGGMGGSEKGMRKEIRGNGAGWSAGGEVVR